MDWSKLDWQMQNCEILGEKVVGAVRFELTTF